MSSIYQPSDDSFFFANFLDNYFKKIKTAKSKPSKFATKLRNEVAFPVGGWVGRTLKFLDMGSGSGILAKTAAKYLPKENILTVDINPKAIKILKQNFNATKSNLFQNIKGKFGIIVFNAPYLPLDKNEPKESRLATTGGKRGDEISIKFLTQAKKHLNNNGKIFLLISSLTPMDKIKKFHPKIVARKKLFFEELRILEINPNP